MIPSFQQDGVSAIKCYASPSLGADAPYRCSNWRDPRDALPAGQSQNQLEEAALLAVVQALPPGMRPVILADRGFARAPFLEWLQSQHLEYVVRVNRGTCLTDGQGHRCKRGEEGLLPGHQRWLPAVRFGLYHDRPRALTLNMALSWRLPQHLARSLRHKTPDEPWSSFNQLDNAPASGGLVSATLVE